MPKSTKLIHYIFFGCLSLLAIAASAKAKPQDSNCLKAISSEIDGCKDAKNLKNFKIKNKSYSVYYLECSEDGNDVAQYAIAEHTAKDKCELRDVDTSFIDYMYGVDADLKSNAPVEVFQAAIKAELGHQLKDKASKQEIIEKYRKRKKLGELTKDQIWVLEYLETEVKK
jgi:hypothetical protein